MALFCCKSMFNCDISGQLFQKNKKIDLCGLHIAVAIVVITTTGWGSWI